MCRPFAHAVICDFDGTITTVDTFREFIDTLCKKEVIDSAMQRYRDGEISLIDAGLAMIESIPVSDLPRVDAYIETMTIRPGFDDFIRYLKEINVPLIVLSGGLHYTVKGKLAPYREFIHAIYSAELDTSGEYLTVVSPCMEPRSYLDKSTVLERLEAEVFIGIGDGCTDLSIADKCHHMFARDKLLEYLRENNLPYIGWNDFYDVIAHMKEHIFV